MNKSYVLIKFQNMPSENLAKIQNSVGPQFSKCVWVWVGVELRWQGSQPASQYGPLERKLVCIWVCVTGYIFGTQILSLIIKSELNGWW